MKVYLIVRGPEDPYVWAVEASRSDAERSLSGKTQHADNRYAIKPVEVDIAALFGEECAECGGEGVVTDTVWNHTGPDHTYAPCPACTGQSEASQ